MGGKGRRRRERNYRAAHGGGQSRLPPPPVPSSLDAVPSKLRQLMSLSSSSSSPQSAAPAKRDRGEIADGGGQGLGKKRSKTDWVTADAKMEGSGELHDSAEKKKKKRKRKPVDDLRFEAEFGAVGSKRKERKKKLLQERKKKHKKGKEVEDFHVHEEIRFGDVVQAPPKLVVPSAFKSRVDASQERIRLKAIEAYRNRRSWASRPGMQLPVPVFTSLSE